MGGYTQQNDGLCIFLIKKGGLLDGLPAKPESII